MARQSLLLDSGWLFKPGDNAGAELSVFDDRAWESVTIPHNWGWQEAQEGKAYYRGPGW